MTNPINQNSEQRARDRIDQMLRDAGWVIQNKKVVDLYAHKGIAIREYQTDVGPADYILFVDTKPVGLIEEKRYEEGHHYINHNPENWKEDKFSQIMIKDDS